MENKEKIKLRYGIEEYNKNSNKQKENIKKLSQLLLSKAREKLKEVNDKAINSLNQLEKMDFTAKTETNAIEHENLNRRKIHNPIFNGFLKKIKVWFNQWTF